MKKYAFLLLAAIAGGATTSAQNNSAPNGFQTISKEIVRNQTKNTGTPRPQPSALSFYTALKANGPFYLYKSDLPETFRPVRIDKRTSLTASPLARPAQSRSVFSEHNLSANVK